MAVGLTVSFSIDLGRSAQVDHLRRLRIQPPALKLGIKFLRITEPNGLAPINDDARHRQITGRCPIVDSDLPAGALLTPTYAAALRKLAFQFDNDPQARTARRNLGIGVDHIHDTLGPRRDYSSFWVAAAVEIPSAELVYHAHADAGCLFSEAPSVCEAAPSLRLVGCRLAP